MQETDYDGLWRRLRYTPLGDTLRGRVTGSLDREAIVARAGIPAELAGVVERTVLSTRLHRDEKAEVARDLAEHFREGIERGETPAQLQEEFGDPTSAGALIRRSMIRKRPWLSRQVRVGFKVSVASLLVLVGLYLVVAINDWRRAPNITIDHVAAMNAPIAATPLSERAWPLMREGLVISRGLIAPDASLEPGYEVEASRRQRHSMLLSRTQESLPPWHGPERDVADDESGLSAEEIDAFFVANDAARGKLLEASTRRILGFEITPDGPIDPADRAFLELGPLPVNPGVAGPIDPMVGSMLQAQFPHLSPVRAAARMLDADARRAILEGDGTRAIEDFQAMLDFGRMVREPSVLIAELVGASIDQLVYHSILDGIAIMPESFTDADLDSIVSMLEQLDEDRFIVDLEGERLLFEDLAQRIYTDDGDGDGLITLHGVQAINGIAGPGGGGGGVPVLQFLATPMLSRVMLSRAEALTLWNDLFDTYVEAAEAPAWEIDRAKMSMLDGRSIADLGSNPLVSMRYFPLTLLVPAIDQAILVGHVGRADRDLAVAAVGVEAARRRLGAWPASMDQVDIPRRPIDPMDGRELAYGLLDGRPAFWSIGPDRDDDGGATITTGTGRTAWDRQRNQAGFGGLTGYWGVDLQPDEGYDGDLVVWQGGDSPVSPREEREVAD